jgi:hypothetical protein
MQKMKNCDADRKVKSRKGEVIFIQIGDDT